MLIQPISYDLQTLFDRLLPHDFWQELAQKYPNIDKDKAEQIKRPEVVMLAKLELERYQEGILKLVEKVLSTLPQEMKATFEQEVKAAYEGNIKTFLDSLSAVLQQNLQFYFMQGNAKKEDSKAPLLDEVTFDAYIQQHRTVLVDFWADWCTPCKALVPILNNLISEYQDKVSIAQVNIEQAPGLQKKFEVTSVPTLLVFQDGELKSRLVGLKPVAEIREALDKLC